MSHRIVLVGHCGVDAPRLESEITRILGDAEIVRCPDETAVEEACQDGADLVMFNRELPYGFDADKGVDLMRDLHKKHPELTMMLISDYDDAQQQAKKAGAVDGFGKADLGSDKVEQCLRAALH